jgi:hypothetical protein
MEEVLKKLRGAEYWVFIDDVLLFSNSKEEHAKSLEHVLERFEKDKLQKPPGKCVFSQPEMQ